MTMTLEPTSPPPAPSRRPGLPLGWKVLAGALTATAVAVTALGVTSGGKADHRPPTVSIRADDKALDVQGGAQLRPGWTHFASSNTSASAHSIELVKLNDGVTVAQLVAGLETPDGEAAMGLIDAYGGTDDIPQGTTFSMTVDLAPGHYVLFDGSQGPQGADGPAWFTLPGFVRDFTVSGSRTAAVPPKETATITTRDFAYDAPSQLAPTGTIKVENAGHELHQAAMVKLDPGATQQQVLDAFTSGGNPPGQPLEFFGIISPGHTMYFDYQLAPANYVIACFMPDTAHGGQPHVAEGMITSFAVA